MKVITVRGSFRQIGREQGEALREEIRQEAEIRPAAGPAYEKWLARLSVFLETAKTCFSESLEELDGLAEGAGLAAEKIYWINFPPGHVDEYDLGQGCTNIAFSSGPDGPILGKNNDGRIRSERIPPAVVISYPDTGLPTIRWVLSGWLSTCDAMNAEGLCVGHSSVGSVFQQSDHYCPIRIWSYEGMKRSRTLAEFVRWMGKTPLRGKGYSILAIDREGQMCSLEAPCPVAQTRVPPDGQTAMNCVNYYQLPTLADADARTPQGKANAKARARCLETLAADADQPDIETLKGILRHHGQPSICRHGGDDISHTEFSYIAIPAQAEALVADGYPCQAEYERVRF